MSEPALLVVGAGPKAMAIAAKNTVLEELGFAVPLVEIVDWKGIGANWTGSCGYTNGRQPLGTSPEKDVGFPYDSSRWGQEQGRAIDLRMARFSWQSYLIADNQFSDWIDRGRPAPEHQQWARYLQWVGGRLSSRVRLHLGEVVGVAIREGRWSVSLTGSSGASQLFGDGLVLTGPGRVRVPRSIPSHADILTVESFWRQYDRFAGIENARIAIVGTGETAAAVALGLVQLGRPGLAIDVISSVGMAYSRGESFRENRVYSGSASANWTMLTPHHRRDFIKRTDRGVFSQTASRLLDLAQNIEIVAGRMTRLGIDGSGHPVLDLEYGESRRSLTADVVVLATGADHLAFLDSVLEPAARAAILAATGADELDQDRMEGSIEYDLGVRGLTPRLHLPMLAGMSQGPGFPNLSCLGHLSDRILETHTLSAPGDKPELTPPRTSPRGMVLADQDSKPH